MRGVMTIKIQREPQLNALNQQVLEALGDALYSEMIPGTTRVVVIEGAGGRAFAAGADIAEMESLSPGEARDFSRMGQVLTRTLEGLPQIVVAKVRGYALGGGLELVMACDLIIASQNAQFGLPEVNLGLIPGFGGTQRLARRVGLPVALDMILCGKARTLKGPEAFQLGLVSRVVADEQLDREVDALCAALLAAGPKAQAAAKSLARRSFEMSLDAGLEAEAQGFGLCFGDEEAELGIRAFLDKKPSPFNESQDGAKSP
jgi:enoyl-CoA hydratase